MWKIQENGVVLKSLLNNNKNSEFCAPLTSFDWNETVRWHHCTPVHDGMWFDRRSEPYAIIGCDCLKNREPSN